MYDTKLFTIPASQKRIFTILLLFYPKQYRKKFGHEMLLVLQDMYQEELEKKGRVGIFFVVSQIGDIIRSIIDQHINMMQKHGVRRYIQDLFSINRYHVIGGALLLPIFLMITVDILSRIFQRDLVHYNRPVYAFLSHTPLYWTPVLFIWVILFPMFAVLINLVPLFRNIVKHKGSIFSVKFVQKNSLSFIILCFGVGFLTLIKLHDFVPCMLYGIAHFGLGQIAHIIAVCRNA